MNNHSTVYGKTPTAVSGHSFAVGRRQEAGKINSFSLPDE